MEEKNYQLDLLKAQNAQLSRSEHIYKLICESSDYGFIYQSLGGEELLTFGSFKSMFGMELHRLRDIEDLLDKFTEEDKKPVRDTLFPESTGRDYGIGKLELVAVWIVYRTRSTSELILSGSTSRATMRPRASTMMFPGT